MTRILVTALLLSALSFTAEAAKKQDNEAKQYELDAACELARSEKLIPEREKYIKECVDKKQRPDRASCERFYADYGNRSGSRAPLYYDLPACKKAFEYRNSHQAK